MIVEPINIEREPEFQPFKFLVTIETKEEAIELWHRLNFNIEKIKKLVFDLDPSYRKNWPELSPNMADHINNLFDYLDEELVKQGLSYE